MSPKERLTNVQLEEARKFGGADKASEFVREALPTYADKGGHKERSLFHQPRHKEHWRKHND